MKRPRSHNVEESAKRLFQSTLPLDWQPREQKPDYGIDYLVEIFEVGQSSGRTFAVQLKGSERLKAKAGVIRYRIETKYLAYYLDKVQNPVFLVLVDVVTKTGYWLFLQAYLLNDLGTVAWREQKSITLDVPIENALADTPKLRKAVELAYSTMAELHPASISGAITTERKRLESIDPRFSVTSKTVGTTTHWTLHAKEPVEARVALHYRDETGLRKAEDLFLRGKPIRVEPGELEISGLPLASRIMEHGGTVHCRIRTRAVARISSTDEKRESSFDVPGRAEGGPREVRFHGESHGVRIWLTCTPNPSDRSLQIRFRVRFQTGAWGGCRLNSLPYFDVMLPFFRTFTGDSPPSLSLLLKPGPLFTQAVPWTEIRGLREISRMVEALWKARQVARLKHLNPLVPEIIGTEQIDQIESVYNLIMNGRHECRAANMTVSVKIGADGLLALLDSLKSGADSGELKLCRDADTLHLFGEAIDVGATEVLITKTTLATERDSIRAMIEGGADSVTVKFNGSSESQMVMLCKSPSHAG